MGKLSILLRTVFILVFSSSLFALEHNTYYDVELPASSVKNQYSSDACWIFAGVSKLEENASRENRDCDINSFDISEHYFHARSIMAKVNQALNNPGTKIIGGAYYSNFVYLVKKYGVVPESAWNPKLDITVFPYSTQIYQLLNSAISSYHESLLVPNIDKYTALKNYKDTMSLVNEIMDYFIGDIPKIFIYEGTEYTPLTFRDKYLSNVFNQRSSKGIWSNNYSSALDIIFLEKISLANISFDDFSNYKSKVLKKELEDKKVIAKAVLKVPAEVEHLGEIEKRSLEDKLSPKKLFKIIQFKIDNGEGVITGIFLNEAYMNFNLGILSLDSTLLGFPFNSPPPSKQMENFIGLDLSHHLILITGYDLDESTGELIKLKYKDSYGEGLGDSGHWHMYKDYFDRYISFIFVSGALQ